MIEVTGNLWTYEPADARCITTNGDVRKDGRAVMGRGCAYEAKERYPDIQMDLGRCLTRAGNHVHELIKIDNWVLLTFPVKHHWNDQADLDLICRSALELMRYLDHDEIGLKHVLLPRPGCGNGRLRWEDVRTVLYPILDDRVYVIDRAV